MPASWGKGAYTNGKFNGAPFWYGASSWAEEGGKKAYEKASTKGKGNGDGAIIWPMLPLRRVGALPEMVSQEEEVAREINIWRKGNHATDNGGDI